MTDARRSEIYENTVRLLKPALERVASDPEFRNRLEADPLQALADMHIELDDATRREMEGRRFSEFWAARQQTAQGPVGVRDLPPGDALSDQVLEGVAGGAMLVKSTLTSFAPPYVPVGPVVSFAPPYVPVGPSSFDSDK